MNIPALSLVVLLAASNASTASAQISSVFGDSRRVRRIKDDSSSRQQRARQMRKLVDAMSVQPDPVPEPTTPPPVPEPTTPAPEPTPPPTPEPTPEPTPSPTDDTCDEQRASYRAVGMADLGKEDELRAKYLYDGNCEDANGYTFSYGELKHDVKDFDDCGKKCLESGASDVVGIDYTCSGKEQFECHCLFGSSADTRSATIVDNEAFDKIVEGGGSGYPTKGKIARGGKVALKARKEDDEVLCGTFEIDVGMDIAKEA
jgi:hypothetical protein